ncbi:hypothetical protein V491_08908 [Pseudogymnoascus sp. VKM F-3775]|nr:hypothetical protein V491_08908 [Pseudogymnoascus sp. VKM F-3775]
MPNAPPMVSELKETLWVKLPDTFSGNRKELESGFKKEIRRIFGDIDEVKTAEDHLYQLKQTGSVLTYATEFQRRGKQLNATWQGQLNATFTGKPNWGINRDSTPKEESSDEESEAESLTTSEQDIYEELAPKWAMPYKYEKLVKHMTKVAYEGIKKAVERPNAEYTLPRVKDLYKEKLEALPH